MKFNGTIFSKPQQDQLKENIDKELEKALGGMKYNEYVLDLSTSDDRNTLISLSQVAKQGKRVVLIDEDQNIYSISKVTDAVYFVCPTISFTNSYGVSASTIYSMVVKPDIAKIGYLIINNNGSASSGSYNAQTVTLFVEK